LPSTCNFWFPDCHSVSIPLDVLQRAAATPEPTQPNHRRSADGNTRCIAGGRARIALTLREENSRAGTEGQGARLAAAAARRSRYGTGDALHAPSATGIAMAGSGASTSPARSGLSSSQRSPLSREILIYSLHFAPSALLVSLVLGFCTRIVSRYTNRVGVYILSSKQEFISNLVRERERGVSRRRSRPEMVQRRWRPWRRWHRGTRGRRGAGPAAAMVGEGSGSPLASTRASTESGRRWEWRR
jgi:hypothetical protein